MSPTDQKGAGLIAAAADRHTALLVAKDFPTAQLLEQTCVEAGLRISFACDLAQAASALTREMSDIVICDGDVPDVNRHNLQQKVPDNVDLHALPFIYVCESSSSYQVSQRIELDQYLPKPFESAALAGLVIRTLDYRDYLARAAKSSLVPPTADRKTFVRQTTRDLQRIQRYGGHLSLCVLEFAEPRSQESPQDSHSALGEFDRAAESLPGMIRSVDLLLRLGPNRHLWAMPETDVQGADLAVRRLLRAFEEAVAESRSSLTIRAGLATAPGDGLDYEELIELAEHELVQRPLEADSLGLQQTSQT